MAAEEYGYVTPDPLDPEIVYGGKLSRYDQRTHQVQEILPEAISPDEFRVIRTEPIVFSPFDPHLLFFAANTLWQTGDGGRSWKEISPDLTRKDLRDSGECGEISRSTKCAAIVSAVLSMPSRHRQWRRIASGWDR